LTITILTISRSISTEFSLEKEEEEDMQKEATNDRNDDSSVSNDDDLSDDFVIDFDHRGAPVPLMPRREQTVRYCVGIDLGQKRDRTAIAVVEVPHAQPLDDRRYSVKYLKRLQQGLLYTKVAGKVKRLNEQLRADAQERGLWCHVTYILDSTGVGEGVSEMIIKALPNADIRKCYLTGGINPSEEGIQIKLPKTQMASTLVALFDDGRVRFPKSSKEIEAMVEELLNYEIHVSEEGHDQYGAFKIGSHDDLVTALGLACWYAEYHKRIMFW
jgi:hypothetical protein